MKTFIALVLTVMGSISYAVEWPDNPVIGMIGASYSDCAAPEQSAFAGMGFAGCSFETLTTALIKEPKVIKKGLRVQSTAQGGAFSYDIPQSGYRGYVSQLNALLARTNWVDGNNRTKYVVASLVIDCLYTQPCTQSEIDTVLIENVRQAAALAHSKNIKLIVTGYPEWKDLNLALIGEIFKFPYLISEQDYNYLSNHFKKTVSTFPGVIYLDVWKNNFSSIDGLHPNEASVKTAAKRIAHQISSLMETPNPL